MDCTIYVAKTKALISCTITVHVIWALVFAFAISQFSHDVAHIHSMFFLLQKN